MELAILLLCHKNPSQINLFINQFNDKNVFFFVHVDQKSDISSQIIHGSNIFLLPDELRVNVRWGMYSQIEAILNLMNFARHISHFNHYWLCSGQDFPIKSCDEILSFFQNHKENNFIQFLPSKNYIFGRENSFDKRNVLYYPSEMMGHSIWKRGLKRIYITISGGYNHTFGIFRRTDKISQIKSFFGSQWICLTEVVVNWMILFLQKNQWYTEEFKHCICPDESFFHTLFMISPYSKTRLDYLHYIDWTEGGHSPKILTYIDLDNIERSNFLMARKFDISVDCEIINNIKLKYKNNIVK